jgi:RNA polymerase sigma factor (sigma-70 family)
VSTGDLYSQHADEIESVLAFVRRSHRLSADDGDEFSSFARLKLIDRDYRVLRQFQGQSTFKTFIVVVISNLFIDWRNSRWGRWRPSAEARRLGAVAIELERIVLRDQTPYEEAVQQLVSKGAVSARRECDELWVRLKQRSPREFVSADAIEEMPARDVDPVEEQEDRKRALAVREALRQARAALPPGDLLIVKLRMESGFTVARIARLQGVDQKALYRRFEQIFKQLRLHMQALGISEGDSASFFGQFGEDGDDPGAAGGNRAPRPSIQPNAGGVV